MTGNKSNIQKRWWNA